MTVVARRPTQRPLASRVVAISTSAGGLSALTTLLAGLPPSLAAAVLIVQHLAPQRVSHLVEILGWHSELEVLQARPAAQLCRATVYVAPPDHHLLVGIDRRLVLSQLPALNYCRPSSDRLFASLATTLGASTVAVVLTGCGRDGAAGAQMIRRSGGMVIVQDPATAEFGDMPRAALHAGAVDHVLHLDAIARMLEVLVASREPA
jgi:two-component system, chemotaxis family, protein-glutamate methylesterase/glutaminase